MSKLFVITRRWLKKDKKRTVLTFLSIILAVYLLSFVSFYLCTLFYSYKNYYLYENGNAHCYIYCTREQADALAKNAAFDKTGWSGMADGVFENRFFKDYLEKSTGGDNDYFPKLYLNGKDVYGKNISFNCVIVGGKIFELEGEESSTELKGRLPEVPGEVTLSRRLASKLGGLEIGDTFKIELNAAKGTLSYTYYDPESEEPAEIVEEDTDGSMIRTVYKQFYDDINNESYFADATDFSLLYAYRPDMNYTESFEELTDPGEAEGKENLYMDMALTNLRPELTGEEENILSYTAEVVGLADGGYFDIGFCKDDDDIAPYINDGQVQFMARVKESVKDADVAIVKAAEGAGMDSVAIDHQVTVNGTVLMLEGRNLEYLGEGTGVIMLVAVVVLTLFIFLARLIINNAFEISASYRTEQYGALKTVGASDNQIFAMIIFESFIYTVISLPIGIALAYLTGKYILAKVVAIGILEDTVGLGMTARLMRMSVTPLFVGVSAGVSVFSIFFSAYADALRVKRMPPIQSVGYRTSKQRRAKKSVWLSRRLFGYPFGFAAKCISKQKVRFTVTMLATILSGIYFISITGLMDILDINYGENIVGADFEVYGFENDYGGGYYSMDFDMETYEIGADEGYEGFDDYGGADDYGEMLPEEESRGLTMVEVYNELKASGYFDNVDVYKTFFSTNGQKYDKEFHENYDRYINSEYFDICDRYYKSGKTNQDIFVFAIGRDEYDRFIDSDISYDELKRSGKFLICNNMLVWGENEYSIKQQYSDYDFKAFYVDMGMTYGVPDIDIFTEKGPFELRFKNDLYIPKEYDSEEEEESDPIQNESRQVTDTYKILGTYTSKTSSYMGNEHAFAVIVPIENYDMLRTVTPSIANSSSDYVRSGQIGATLIAKEGMAAKAGKYLRNAFPSADIVDIYMMKQQAIKTAKTIGVAGNALALVLVAVAALNIFSTMNSNMLNRRRDLSMMRSCGMSMKQVVLSLFYESLIYGLVSSLISMIAGTVITALMTDSITMGGRLDIPVGKSVGILLVSVVIMALAAAPTLMLMNRNAISQEIRTE